MKFVKKFYLQRSWKPDMQMPVFIHSHLKHPWVPNPHPEKAGQLPKEQVPMSCQMGLAMKYNGGEEPSRRQNQVLTEDKSGWRSSQIIETEAARRSPIIYSIAKNEAFIHQSNPKASGVC